jgi:hypothetical protein
MVCPAKTSRGCDIRWAQEGEAVQEAQGGGGRSWDRRPSTSHGHEVPSTRGESMGCASSSAPCACSKQLVKEETHAWCHDEEVEVGLVSELEGVPGHQYRGGLPGNGVLRVTTCTHVQV